MPPRVKGGKFMLGESDIGTALVNNYLNDIQINTFNKSNVKTVEDIQSIIAYFNTVISDIEVKKKNI